MLKISMHLHSGKRSTARSSQPCLQRVALRPVEPARIPPIVQEVLRSPGQPLDQATRSFMESRFGHDFSQVHVHSDPRAAASAMAVDALAYTVGRDVVFGSEQYAPETHEGRRLIAHELTHVLQQHAATVESGAVTMGDASDCAEKVADTVADEVVTPSIPVGTSSSASHFRFPARHLAALTLLRQEKRALSAARGTAGGPIVLDSFDVDRGEGQRPWKLDQLSKQIASGLAELPDAYIDVTAFWDPNEEIQKNRPLGSERDAAKKRAELVRKALIQWVPLRPSKIRASTFDRSLLSAGAALEKRQVSVALIPTPALATAQPPLPPSLRIPPQPTPLPRTVPATALSPPSLLPAQPYPGTGMDAFRAFLSTPPGEKFKDAGIRELKRVWTKTSVAEKIVILTGILTTLGIGTYGLTQMPPQQQRDILHFFTKDDDWFLQRPLPEKATGPKIEF